jgi:hypothetical protein
LEAAIFIQSFLRDSNCSVNRKDTANKRLAAYLKELEDTQVNDKKIMKRHFEATLKRKEIVCLPNHVFPTNNSSTF